MTLLASLYKEWAARFVFLAFTFSILFGCSGIVYSFEHILRSNIQLSFFLSLVIGHCGNCGGQTVATVVRQCKVQTVTANVVLSETILSCMSTVLLVIAFLLIGTLMNFDRWVLFVSASSLLIMAPVASFVGSSACALTHWLKRDPAIYAGPIMTTIVDFLGVLVYIGIASQDTTRSQDMTRAEQLA